MDMLVILLFQPASMLWLLALLVLIVLGLVIFSPGGVWFPTSKKHIRQMLEMAELKPGELVYDLGCADGRVLIVAAQEFGARGVGIEIDPLRYRLARWRVRRAGLEDQITLIRGSFHDEDLSPANVVTLYLVQEMINRLAPKLARDLNPGTRLVSNTFVVPGLKISRYDRPADLRLYTIPKKKNRKRVNKQKND